MSEVDGDEMMFLAFGVVGVHDNRDEDEDGEEGTGIQLGNRPEKIKHDDTSRPEGS